LKGDCAAIKRSLEWIARGKESWEKTRVYVVVHESHPGGFSGAPSFFT